MVMTSNMSKKVLQFLRLAGLVLLLMPILASASVVRWTFNNVKFDDGATLSGYFDYDATSQAFLDRSIAVAGGNTATFPNLTYTSTNSFVEIFDSPQINGQTILFRSNPPSTRFVSISVLAPLSNGGGNLVFATTGDFIGHECYNCAPFRVITAGASITGVATQFTLNPGITGNWYDPAQNGHGFQFEVLDGNVVTMFWFTFDNAGHQAWIGGAGTASGASVDIQGARITNGHFPPNFNPDTVDKPVWGTLHFLFADCNHAVVTWNAVDAGFTATGTMSLVRATKISGLNCS
jgi:hypothetical protein